MDSANGSDTSSLRPLPRRNGYFPRQPRACSCHMTTQPKPKLFFSSQGLLTRQTSCSAAKRRFAQRVHEVRQAECGVQLLTRSHIYFRNASFSWGRFNTNNGGNVPGCRLMPDRCLGQPGRQLVPEHLQRVLPHQICQLTSHPANNLLSSMDLDTCMACYSVDRSLCRPPQAK